MQLTSHTGKSFVTPKRLLPGLTIAIVVAVSVRSTTCVITNDIEILRTPMQHMIWYKITLQASATPGMRFDYYKCIQYVQSDRKLRSPNLSSLGSLKAKLASTIVLQNIKVSLQCTLCPKRHETKLTLCVALDDTSLQHMQYAAGVNCFQAFLTSR